MATHWQDFITTQLEATGAVHEAIIMGKGDGVTWASTKDFETKVYKATVMNEDCTESEQEVNEQQDLVRFAQTLKKPAAGIRINGTKFMPIRTFEKGQLDDGIPTVFLKQKGGGGCLCITKQAIIIATFSEDKKQTSPACNAAVEALARYLYQSGF